MRMAPGMGHGRETGLPAAAPTHLLDSGAALPPAKH